MGQKLHRSRRYTYRRKKRWLPVLGWICAAAILIPGSFFAAKMLAERRQSLPASEPDASAETTAPTAAEPTAPTTAPTPDITTQAYRGFYLPAAALRDTAALQQTCQSAAAAGFNCAVVELKGRGGEVYYVSETEPGQTAAAAAADAMPLSAVKTAFETMRTAGILPVAKLYAFEDAIAPRSIPGAKVTTVGHADWTWYDGDPNQGGRPWLNPYAEPAQAYIAALAEELHTAGAGALLLDAVYFPTQTLQAAFTAAGDASLSKAQVLQRFVARIDALSDAPVFLASSANAALGNNTAGYTCNPLSLGAAAVTPDVSAAALGKRVSIGGEMQAVSAETLPETVTKIVRQLQTGEHAPIILPQIDAQPAVIAALKAAAQNASFLVYDANGRYDFAAFA